MNLKEILQQVAERKLSVEEALALEKPQELDLGHTLLDLDRPRRNGFTEVIYGEGKTAVQVGDIFERMKQHSNILATRVPEKTAEHVLIRCPDAVYHQLARALTWTGTAIDYFPGEVGIVTAGTSDLPVAEEAKVTCEMLGCHARLIQDVGVAGIHRLFGRLDEIRKFQVLIVIAGMEGALASVIGGLVPQPIIAVPTSTGYGAAFAGISALLGMLTSCASGITVVNIDNGFGAACAALRICSAKK